MIVCIFQCYAKFLYKVPGRKQQRQVLENIKHGLILRRSEQINIWLIAEELKKLSKILKSLKLMHF